MLQGVGALGVASAITSSGLRGAAAQNATPAPLDYPQLAITAVEFSFQLPQSVPGSWTQVVMDNQGTMPHNAMFMRPHEGATVDDIQAALDQADFGALLAAADSLGGPNSGAGQHASVVMNLEPGQYVLICSVTDDQGIPHFVKGMRTTLEVTEPASTGEAPAADATVSLVEMAFDGIPTDATAGTHIWEVTNQGEVPHELALLRLAPGVAVDQAMQVFEQEFHLASPVASPMAGNAMATPGATVSGPPFVEVGGAAPMTAGQVNYAILELTPAEYIALCFVTDFQTGKPHFAEGMMQTFTVG